MKRSLAMLLFLLVTSSALAKKPASTAAPVDNDSEAWHGILVVNMMPEDKTAQEVPQVVFMGGRKYIGVQAILHSEPPRRQGDGTYVFETPDSKVADEVRIGPDDDFDVVLVRSDCVAHLVVRQVSERRIAIPFPNIVGFVYQIVMPHKFGQLDGVCAEFRPAPPPKKRSKK